jgi:RNA polymerase sigma-70 factor (ECF subfamily)
MMDEEALIRDAKRGDLDAFNRLVIAYQSLAYNIAYRIMGEPQSAADATQEAFISAFKNIRQFRGGSFRSWLLRIVTNACYDELRRRKRRPAVSLEGITTQENGSESDSLGFLDSGEMSPERASELGEVADAIQDCINRLPDDFKVVVVLVDVQGYDYREASQVIDRPLGTVKSRLARARANLRDCLQRYRELLPASFRLEDEASL